MFLVKPRILSGLLPSGHILAPVRRLLSCSQSAFRADFKSAQSANSYFTSLTIEKIGLITEIAMNPTTTPIKMISAGSIIEVKPFTVCSTS